MKSKLSTKILRNYATQLMTKKAMYAAAIALLATNVDAQKKPLDLTVFDEWQSIGMKELSNNGSWVAYQVNAQESDNTLNLPVNNGLTTKLEYYKIIGKAASTSIVSGYDSNDWRFPYLLQPWVYEVIKKHPNYFNGI